MEVKAPTQAEISATTRRKTRKPSEGVKVIPLALETRSHVETDQAAAHLLRQPQTLRCWAMHENGPIRPVRVGVRLMWPVAAIKAVLGLEVAQ